MAIPASFDSATGALAATGDDLDNTIATAHDATRPTPSLRGDPDAGGQIQSAVHRPTPSLRSDPDSGGQIQSAVHQPTPSLRSDPDAGGQMQSAVQRPTPSLRDDPDSGGQIQSAVHGPTPSLWDDPDAGGQIQSVVQQFAGGQHQSTAPDMPARAISWSCWAQPPGWCRPRRHFPPRAPRTPRIRSRSGPRHHSRRF
jgi:hypothetical protein